MRILVGYKTRVISPDINEIECSSTCDDDDDNLHISRLLIIGFSEKNKEANYNLTTYTQYIKIPMCFTAIVHYILYRLFLSLSFLFPVFFFSKGINYCLMS